jgi:hypothetical protein
MVSGDILPIDDVHQLLPFFARNKPKCIRCTYNEITQTSAAAS